MYSNSSPHRQSSHPAPADCSNRTVCMIENKFHLQKSLYFLLWKRNFLDWITCTHKKTTKFIYKALRILTQISHCYQQCFQMCFYQQYWKSEICQDTGSSNMQFHIGYFYVNRSLEILVLSSYPNPSSLHRISAL